MPPAMAKRTKMKTSNLLRALAAIMRSMMVLAARFFGVAVSVHHDFSAPWIFDSASIRKLALATTRSPSFKPLFTA